MVIQTNANLPLPVSKHSVMIIRTIRNVNRLAVVEVAVEVGAVAAIRTPVLALGDVPFPEDPVSVSAAHVRRLPGTENPAGAVLIPVPAGGNRLPKVGGSPV